MLLIWCSYYALSKGILIFQHLYWHVIFTLNFMYKSYIWQPLPVSGLLLDMGCGLISSWNLHLVSGHEVSCAPQVLTSQDMWIIYIYIYVNACMIIQSVPYAEKRNNAYVDSREWLRNDKVAFFSYIFYLLRPEKKNP